MESRRNLFDYHTPALGKRTIVTKRQRAKMRQFKSISAYYVQQFPFSNNL